MVGERLFETTEYEARTLDMSKDACFSADVGGGVHGGCIFDEEHRQQYGCVRVCLSIRNSSCRETSEGKKRWMCQNFLAPR